MDKKTAITIAIIGVTGTLIVALINGTSALVVALIDRLRLNDARDTISKDIAIYKMLPSKSSVRSDLLKRIDENVANVLIYNRSVRRDIPGVITLFFEFVLGASVGLYIADNSAMLFDWQFWLHNPIYLVLELTSVIAVLFLVLYNFKNIASRYEKRLRDENGNPVKEPHQQARITIWHRVSLWGRSLLKLAKKRDS